MRASMRTLVAALTVLATAALPASAQASRWLTPPAALSPVTGGALGTPLIATNARGDTVVVWPTSGSNTGPYMENERPTGANTAFSAPAQPVLDPGTGDLNTNGASQAQLFLDNSGMIYLFFVSGTGFVTTSQINVATKPIGGSTWTVTVIQPHGNVGGFVPGPPFAAAVAPNGTAVAIWLQDFLNNASSSTFDYSTKAAGSSSWSTPAGTAVNGNGTSVHAAINSNGDAAAVFGFPGNANLFGATKPAAGGWSAAPQITTSLGGNSMASNQLVVVDSAGQATAIWTMSDASGANPVVQFSSTTVGTPWPQAASPTAAGGPNNLSPVGSSAGVPSLAVAPNRTTIVAYTLGSDVMAETRAGTGGTFSPSTLSNTLSFPQGADAVAGSDNSTTVLWSGQNSGASEVAGAHRSPTGSTFSATPIAPGTGDSNVAAAADGFGDVAAVWQAQPTLGSFQFAASGLVTAPPRISNVGFPSAVHAGQAFGYHATVTPPPWTTASGSVKFGDGTTGPLSGTKTYHSAGTFHAVLTATDPFGDKATVTRTIKVIAKPNTDIVSSDVNAAHHRATFGFKATGAPATGFQCSLVRVHAGTVPKPSYGACVSPKKYTHLRKGRYKFFVRARNAAGPDPTPATHSFSI